jgi:hypothetical protein
MKKKLVLTAMFGMMLALGMTVMSCGVQGRLVATRSS